MLPEFGCLSKAYPNYLNLLNLQPWPRNFWLFLTGPGLDFIMNIFFIKIFGTSDSDAAYKLQTRN